MELCSCLSLGAVRCVETGTTTIVHNVADLVQIVLLGLAELLTAASHSTDESAMSHSFFCLTAVSEQKSKREAAN